MKDSLRALLSNILDYAGLFPPASLSLDQTYRNYCQYLASDDRWMLGRLICPVEGTGALADLIAASPASSAIPVCILGKAEHDIEQLLEAGTQLTRRFGGLVDFGAIEMPASPDSISTKLRKSQFARSSPNPAIFFEIGWNGDWRSRWTAAVQLVIENQNVAGIIGLKLRTGGVTAEAFPPSSVVAGVIDLCRQHGVKLKFTAGLHHPVRRYHDSVQTRMHGFINVFAAGVMAWTHGMDAHGIVEILETEDPGEFSFDDYGMKWKTLHAATQRIKQVRDNALISFGSCSFDEPRDDLRALNWW